MWCGLLQLISVGLLASSVRVAESSMCLAANLGWQAAHAEDIGVCYYFRDSSSRQQVNYSKALEWCQTAAVATGVNSLRLTRMVTEQQRTLLIRALTAAGIGYWNIWADTFCNSTTSQFTWKNGALVTELKQITCNNSVAVQLICSAVPEAGSYKVTSSLSAISTGSLGTTVCEYELPRCNISLIEGFDSTRMQLDGEPIPGRVVKVACAPGFYRSAEADGTPESKVRNRYDCMNRTNAELRWAEFVPKNNTVVDTCVPMQCSVGVLLNLPLNVDFKDYKNAVNPSKEYKFGESIPVQCKTGYVKITNLTDVNSTINCIQNESKPSEGQWDPIFCTPVSCNRSAMSSAFDPNTMQMYKAFDRLKNHMYTEAETHLFSYYPNMVYVRCKTSGQFFKDRKYDKTFQCNLLPDSSIQAGWTPVEGTIEASMQCQPITCLTNELVAMSYRSTIRDYLRDGNFNSSVVMTDETDLVTNMTMTHFLTVSEYKYIVSVKFDCNYGFAMSATNESDGKIVSLTSIQSTCSSTGSWNKLISQCIKLSGAIDATSGKKYVPPPKEAGSARSLGVIVIVILVVFFTVIVILDLATLSRDIKLLKLNIKRLRLRAKMLKTQ